jgi:hypothetical protein
VQIEMKRKTRGIYRGENIRILDPKRAYILLMRFLNNPCPNIAAIILEREEEIEHIAKAYRQMLRQGKMIPGYIEGAQLFLRTLDQVKTVIIQFGFDDLKHLDEEARPYFKIPRVDIC